MLLKPRPSSMQFVVNNFIVIKLFAMIFVSSGSKMLNDLSNSLFTEPEV